MHPASVFRTTDPVVLIQRFKDHPFCTIIGVAAGRPLAAHAPVLVSEAKGVLTLLFHLTRANALNAALKANPQALIIAMGPNGYISPDWYDLEDQVPTWNYISAEASGPVQCLTHTQTMQQMNDLSATQEERIPNKKPWTSDKMSPGLFEKMASVPIGYSMTVEMLVGTTKLSQNKAPEAQLRMADHLEAMPDAGSHAIAALSRAHLAG